MKTPNGAEIDDPPDPRVEIEGLRARITELESSERLLREELRRAERIAEKAPFVLYIFDWIEQRTVYANREITGLLGYGPDELKRLGSGVLPALMHPDDLARMPDLLARQAAARDGDVVENTYRMRHTSGLWRWFRSRDTVFTRGADGAPAQILGAAHDVTAEVEAELDLTLRREGVIEAQQEALRELGTPLIPIADGVVAMPLIGVIDSARAAQILETLLEGISRYRASSAILDVTGVKVVDSHVAGALLRAARAAGLLGAEVVLTGIGPTIAQTLVGLGADFRRLVICGTFEDGIAYANRNDGP
jgi:rsbT co-antagonist protein RsbR